MICKSIGSVFVVEESLKDARFSQGFGSSLLKHLLKLDLYINKRLLAS